MDFCVRKVEVSGLQLHGLFPFTISLNNGKSFVAAATSQEDRFNWTEVIIIKSFLQLYG